MLPQTAVHWQGSAGVEDKFGVEQLKWTTISYSLTFVILRWFHLFAAGIKPPELLQEGTGKVGTEQVSTSFFFFCFCFCRGRRGFDGARSSTCNIVTPHIDYIKTGFFCILVPLAVFLVALRGQFHKLLNMIKNGAEPPTVTQLFM